MSKANKKKFRRIYSAKFKADTVALVHSGGRTVPQVAGELGLSEGRIYAWLRERQVDTGEGPAGALTTPEREELSHLRREVKVLRMEREILKQAATFFAKENA